jgi:hypothetical protein
MLLVGAGPILNACCQNGGAQSRFLFTKIIIILVGQPFGISMWRISVLLLADVILFRIKLGASLWKTLW